MVRLKYHSVGDIWKVFVAPQNTFPCFLLNCLRKQKKPWLLMKLQLTFPFIPTFRITFVKPTKHCKVDICLFWDRSSRNALYQNLLFFSQQWASFPCYPWQNLGSKLFVLWSCMLRDEQTIPCSHLQMMLCFK